MTPFCQMGGVIAGAPFVDEAARRKKAEKADFAQNSLEGTRAVLFPGLSDVLAAGGKAAVGREVPAPCTSRGHVARFASEFGSNCCTNPCINIHHR